jgi:hypothetical protein
MKSAFAFNRGDDFDLNVTFKDSAGAAIDITGCTVFFTMKSDPEDADADAVVEKTVTIHTDPAHGITLVSLDHSDTDLLKGRYYYDLQLVDDVTHVVHSTRAGVCEVYEDITRRTS